MHKRTLPAQTAVFPIKKTPGAYPAFFKAAVYRQLRVLYGATTRKVSFCFPSAGTVTFQT